MKKTSTHFSGNSPIVDFHAEVKTHTAPEIVESYIADNGDMIHILKSGNELSENNYLKHWGEPKQKINMKAKPKGLDSRRNFY